jgi:hypothetical protein
VKGKQLDVYGDALACATLSGDGWRTKHDAIKWTIHALSVNATLPTTVEVYGLFAAYLNQGQAIPGQSDRTRQGLVPDFKFSPHGRPEFLAELKCINSSAEYFNDVSARTRNGGVAKRATTVHSDYVATAAKADREINNFVSAGGSKGPMQERLEQFGKVHALVVGPRGECSDDLAELLRMIATTAGNRKWRELGATSPVEARAVYLERAFRAVGITAARANAQMLRERLGIWRSGSAQSANVNRAEQKRQHDAARDEYASSFGGGPWQSGRRGRT